jgi:hypothetical protein
MSYDNTNRGQIWINDRKEKDTHPDFKGSMNIDGVEYWVSAWKRKPDANPKAPPLTFSIRKKDMNAAQATKEAINNQQAEATPSALHAEQPAPDFSDDIPFMRISNVMPW